jgi:hypothetical protein
VQVLSTFRGNAAILAGMSGPPFKLDLADEAAATLPRGGLLGGAVTSPGALAGVSALRDVRA